MLNATLFCFARPLHTLAVLTSIARAARRCSVSLRIICDGTPERADRELCKRIEDTRRIVGSEQWGSQQQIIIREANLGCDASIVDGINAAFRDHEFSIFLEDDTVVSPHFFEFMQCAEEKYRDRARVYAISGFMYPVEEQYVLPPAFFSCFLNFWGWATWRDRWSRMIWSASQLIALLDAGDLITRFNLGRPECIEWLRGLVHRQDSYDVKWYASILAQSGLVLYPGMTYIRNIGFDGSGSHSGFFDRYSEPFTSQPINSRALSRAAFPEDIAGCELAVEAVERSCDKLWGRKLP
jgi:hypothetical protein